MADDPTAVSRLIAELEGPPARERSTRREFLARASTLSLVIPGVGYGEHGDGYVRMSLTINGDRAGERVDEAIERIRQKITLEF